ncbi:MAG: GNAT family N-acetyltransferase [Steroidobacteraceae bacterium]|nr:GNAT family N-acetyltransferase [Steroidobacteraceae bacterium]
MNAHRQWRHAGYVVDTDHARLDVEAVHGYLSRSYWAAGIPRETVERSLAGSLCFGLYDATGAQVGLARVITDRATFAYLCDVYVLEAHRGRGLAKFLMQCVGEHPELQGLRRFLLVTADAYGLYSQFGFASPARPDRLMEKLDPEVYARSENAGPRRGS